MITKHREMFDVDAHDDDEAIDQPMFGVTPQPPALSVKPLLFAVEPSDHLEIDLTA
jgi:hypothetical protein